MESPVRSCLYHNFILASNFNMGVESEISNSREDIKEIKHLLALAKRPKVEALLTVELRRFETKLSELLETVESQKSKETTTDALTQSSSTKSYDVAYKSYSWDQSDKFVKFYLTNLKNVQDLPQPDGFEKSFLSRSVKLRVCNLSGKNHVFEIKELAHEIDVEKSYYKVKSDMVVIFLAKSNAGQNWSHVTAAEKEKAEKKNEIPKPDDNDDPSKGLMNMMKKMYDEGDDDMKKTIAKAWTESQNKGPGAGLGSSGMGDMDL